MIDISVNTMMELAERLERAEELYKEHKGSEAEADIPAILYNEFIPEAIIDRDINLGKKMSDYIMRLIREFRKAQAEFASMSESELHDSITAQLGDMLKDQTLRRQCQTLHQIRQAIDYTAANTEIGRLAGDGYTGDESVRDRDELLNSLADSILSQQSQQEFLPVQLHARTRARLKDMDDELYRAVLSVSIYTLLLDPECGENLSISKESLEFVVAEVCACTVDSSQPTEDATVLNWRVLKWLVSAVIIGGEFAICALAGTAEVAAISYMISLYAVLAVFVYANELESKPAGIPLVNYATAGEWNRVKAHVAAAAGVQEVNTSDNTGEYIPVTLPLPNNEA